MEALFLDERGYPLGCGVVLDDILFNISDLDEPAVEATVHKRSLTAPAEGVAMVDSTLGKNFALVLQVLNDLFISIFDVLASVFADDRQELAILVDRHRSRAWFNQALLDTSSVIILTKTRSAVDDTSTGVFGDEVGADD